MQTELYTDGIEEITVTGTIVRVDLVTLSPTERDAGDHPKKVFCQRLIFSAEAFANSVDVMQNALRGLADAGVITRTHPRLATTTPTPADNRVAPTVSSDPGQPNVSSNFR
jgi:hypothetical protein